MGNLIVSITKHREERRIVLQGYFRKGTAAYDAIRALPGSRFSIILNDIPYCNNYHTYIKDALADLIDVKIVFEEPEPLAMPNTKDHSIEPEHSRRVIVRISQEKKQFYIDHGYNEKLYSLLAHLEKGFWSKVHKNWIFQGNNEIYLHVRLSQNPTPKI